MERLQADASCITLGWAQLGAFIVVLLAAGGIAAWCYYKSYRATASIATEPTIRLRGSGDYEFAVLGTSRYVDALEKIYGKHDDETKRVEALLVLEDGQAKKSVRVDIQGQTVGYLAPELAVAYRKRLVEGGYPSARGICSAKIHSRLHRSIGGPDYTVRLDLPKRSNAK